LFRLTDISLVQFKNYDQRNFHFDQRIVGICGKNGIGKTNLLDAIYYLSFTKSYFSKSDAQNVCIGRSGFRLQGQFQRESAQEEVTCILRETGKKEFVINGEVYTRFSSHIGKLPLVIIAPDDVQIISGGSEERRRFLDAILSQLDQDYLQQLIRYNKLLQQRNSLLKSFAESRRTDDQLLEVLKEQLKEPGAIIFEKRTQFLNEFLPLVQEFYKKISGEDYAVDIRYESQLLQCSYDQLFRQFREKDLILQRTNGGIHKDDLDISLNGNAFKTMASQGQRKSMLFALRLAEFEVLKEGKGFTPLLLLDDVFEKLDQGRMQNLLEWVCKDNDGQIFITDTHCDRLEEHLWQLEVTYQLVNL
jgi:DNA replication and repair protein RecF